MKKLTALMLAMVMILGMFAGCGSDASEPSTPPHPRYPQHSQHPRYPLHPR